MTDYILDIIQTGLDSEIAFFIMLLQCPKYAIDIGISVCNIVQL